MNLDTASPTGRLMVNLLGSIAQFERELMLERQRIGIAEAKAAGKYRGRAHTAREKADDLIRMVEKGTKPEDAAKILGVARSSAFRLLAEHRAKGTGG